MHKNTNNDTDKGELIDLLLDFYLVLFKLPENCIPGLNSMNKRIANKLSEEKYHDCSMLYEKKFLYWKKKQPRVMEALEYFYNLSTEYGVYATHFRSCFEKDYPHCDFDIEKLLDLQESQYPQIQSQNISSYLKIFNPDEFNSMYEFQNFHDNEKSCREAYLSEEYAFLVKLSSKNFNIEEACEAITRALSRAFMSEFGIAQVKSTPKTLEIHKDYLQARELYKISGKSRSRMIGLKMWDLVNPVDSTKQKMNPTQAAKHLQKEMSLWGAIKKCSHEFEEITNCKECPEFSAADSHCIKRALEWYNNADASISSGIMSTLSRSF